MERDNPGFCENCGVEIHSNVSPSDYRWYEGTVRCVPCHVVEVADRFLRREATIGELRAAVKAAKGIDLSPTYERDRKYLAETGERPAGYTEEEIGEMEADLA